jgi:transcriptional regulator with XRE-family HTH domain
MDSIGNRLRKARKRAGLTQEPGLYSNPKRIQETEESDMSVKNKTPSRRRGVFHVKYSYLSCLAHSFLKASLS